MISKNQQVFKLQSVLEYSRIGTWEWNVQTGEVYFDDVWFDMIGYKAEELAPITFKTWTVLAHPDDLKASNALLEQYFSGAISSYDLECRLKHKNGYWVWCLDRGRIVSRTDDGKPLLVIGSHEDITERKNTEEALRESEERFKSLHNASFGGITIHDKGLILECNQGLADISGYAVSELIGMDGLLLIAEKSRDYVRSRIASGYEKPYEAFGVRKDGTEYPIRLEARNVHYKGREVRTVEFRDITEQKKNEEAILAEKERLSVTLRSIGDGVITTDINSNIVLMNKVAEDLTGWKQEEAQGKKLDTVFTVVHEKTRKPLKNPVKKVLTTGSIIEMESQIVLISRDGTERRIDDSGAPIKDKDGQTIGVVLVFRDTTEKQKLMEIAQNTQKLESLGILAGGIAHDFNNLMGGIFGYIDMAKEAAEDERVISYLTQALNTIDRARALTRQLLTFAKGGAPIPKTDSLFPFIEETVKFALSGANVSPRFNIPEDLWLCSFNKNQIGQVIDNLVINAQQAMPVGGTIEVSACNVTLADKEHPVLNRGKYVKISIKDTGIGIPQELLSRIFDPFFTTKTRGHGLGLATCFSIVSRHEGSISVESEPGKGTTFHIYLPASDKEAPMKTAEPDAVHHGSGIFLVMDDEEVMRDILTVMLGNFGYTVHCTQDGKEAVSYFLEQTTQGKQIKGMIFDLTVPGGMGGKEAIEEIRNSNTDIPAFVSSGYADDPVMTSPSEYGFTASICKPYNKKELSKMLKKYLNRVLK